MSEYVKDLSVILAVDWCARPALLLQPGTGMSCSRVLEFVLLRDALSSPCCGN